MKRSKIYQIVLLFFVTILTVSQGHSQISDSTRIAKKDALKVLQKGYESKAFEAQRDLLLNQVDTLRARISIKEMMIINLNGQISDYKNIVSSKDAIISTQSDQRTLLEQQLALKNKEIKKQRRAKKWTALLGIVTTSAMTFLFLTK